MSLIRSSDTKPELIVRSLLHRMGYRFRLHVKNLPGKPDIVLPKYSTVIFVHGCFWHGHLGCRRSNKPKSNQDYWIPKIESNKARDKKHALALSQAGWRVLAVWECAVKDLDALSLRFAAELVNNP